MVYIPSLRSMYDIYIYMYICIYELTQLHGALMLPQNDAAPSGATHGRGPRDLAGRAAADSGSVGERLAKVHYRLGPRN